MCTALAVNCSVGDDDNGWFGFRCSYCCSWTHGNELGTDKPIKRPAEVERPNTQLSTKKPNNNHLDLLFLFWLESSAHFTKFHKSNSAYLDVHCVWLGEQTQWVRVDSVFSINDRQWSDCIAGWIPLGRSSVVCWSGDAFYVDDRHSHPFRRCISNSSKPIFSRRGVVVGCTCTIIVITPSSILLFSIGTLGHDDDDEYSWFCDLLTPQWSLGGRSTYTMRVKSISIVHL